MRNKMRKILLSLLLAVTATTASAQTKCTNWPCRPVELILSLSPGGSADGTARVLAQKFEQEFKQPMAIIFAPGGDGVTGMNKFFEQAKNDDHVLYQTRSGTNLFNFVMYESTPYQNKDFNHVALLATFPYFVTTSAESEFNSIAELSKVSRINVGVTSPGEALVIEQLARKQGWKDYAIINYKGNAPLNLALLTKEINLAVTLPFPAVNNVKDGKLKFLASVTNDRSPLAPNVLTLREQGLNLDYSGFYGIAIGNNVDPTVTAKLNAFFKKFANDPDVQEKFALMGCSIQYYNTKQYTQWIGNKISTWEGIRKSAGIPKKNM